jgi:FixJ family two-component response regulator
MAAGFGSLPTTVLAQPSNLLFEMSAESAFPKSEAIVFVVDDDLAVRQGLERLLRAVGWKVETFASAQEFLAHRRENIPGCLVLDVRLPGLSGLDLQKRILEANSQIPIVFITGHQDVPTSVRAMKAGAVEFLVKPFSERDLLEAIKQAVKRDQSARHQQAQMEDLWSRYESLTKREREVMEGVVSGFLNKRVAAELGVSEITVKVKRGQVMHKMRAASLVDLVRMHDKLRSWRASKR